MDDAIVNDWLQRDVVEEMEIMPARFIYATDFNMSIWHVRECFWIWREIMYKEDKNMSYRVQAWQYVKAYSKILKAKNQWNYRHGIPLEHKWDNLTPNSPQWIAYYMKHPDEQEAMHTYRRHWERMKKGVQHAEA